MDSDIQTSLIDQKVQAPSVYSEAMSGLVKPKIVHSMGTTMLIIIKSVLPMTLTYFLRYSVQIFMFYLLKSYKDDDLTGAYGIGNTFLNVVCTSIVISLNVGLLSRLAQAYGRGKLELMGLYFHRGLIINFLVQVFLSVLIYFSHFIFVLVGYEESLARNVRYYMLCNLPSNYLFMVFHTCNFYLVACRIFKPAAYMQMVSSLGGAAMAYYLIDKLKWGLEGAAFANATMNILMVILMVTYIRITNPVPGSMFAPRRQSFTGLWKLFKHQVLVGSMIFVEWVGVEIIGLSTGLLSSDQVAAYPATLSAFQPFYTVPITLSNTLLTFIGSAMGEENVAQAKRYLVSGIVLSMTSAIICISVFLPLAHEIASLVLESPDAIDDSIRMIYIYLICVPADFLQIVMGAGLRAIGKEKIGFYILVGSIYGIAIPLSFFLCFYMDMDMWGLVWGTNVGFYMIFILYTYVYMKTSWKLQSYKISQKIEKDSILASTNNADAIAKRSFGG